MMKEENILDSEIRVIGGNQKPPKTPFPWRLFAIIVGVIAVLADSLVSSFGGNGRKLLTNRSNRVCSSRSSLLLNLIRWLIGLHQLTQSQRLERLLRIYL